MFIIKKRQQQQQKCYSKTHVFGGTNLQEIGVVVGVILCLNDNIGEVGEAIGDDIGKKVILGLGLWIGRNGEEGTDGGLDELLEDEKEVAAGDIFLLSRNQDWGAVVQ